ncbi:MAG TPA: DUF2076 domain-containing protein [Rhodopila sp.]|jgi:hypothetical protein|nr:DUF2076 domain-containing protein [Rhodopila sp.]
MTNEERDIISQFIARVGGATQQSGFAAGSVPATQPALPPVDRDADAYIAQAFNQYPEARYRVTQLAFVQEHALAEAQNRIQRLEWELQQAKQAAQQASQQAAQQAQQSGGKPGGGFFSGLFGGGASRPQAASPQGDPRWGGQAGYQGGQPQQPYYQQAAPPPPQYPPNYQQGMFQQRGGSGFLGSALTTAAGVAGGMVAGQALMNLFSPHQGYGGGFGGEAAGGPWATPGAPGQDYVDTGTWGQGGGAAPAGNQDYVDNGSWDQSGSGSDASWTDNGNSSDSSWTDNSNSSDSSWTDNSGGGDSSWDSGGSSDDTF